MAPHRPTPMGTEEVADVLAVPRPTVSTWRSRPHVRRRKFPEPDGQLGRGNRRAWWWPETIEEWARETGNWPHGQDSIQTVRSQKAGRAEPLGDRLPPLGMGQIAGFLDVPMNRLTRWRQRSKTWGKAPVFPEPDGYLSDPRTDADSARGERAWWWPETVETWARRVDETAGTARGRKWLHGDRSAAEVLAETGVRYAADA